MTKAPVIKYKGIITPAQFLEAADEAGILPMYTEVIQKRLVSRYTYEQIAEQNKGLPKRRIDGRRSHVDIPNGVRRRELRTLQQVVYYIVLGRPFRGAYNMDDLE